jgi:Anthrone oxygenase
MTTPVIELVAVLACTLFTGAAIYITAVEHPARLSCGTEIAATQWAPSYKRATVMQAPLAIIGGLFGLIRGVQGGGLLWITPALLILSVVPFTLIVIRPTNDRLLDAGLDRTSNEARLLLRSWGHLHAVRSVVSALASVLFIWAVVR